MFLSFFFFFFFGGGRLRKSTHLRVGSARGCSAGVGHVAPDLLHVGHAAGSVVQHPLQELLLRDLRLHNLQDTTTVLSSVTPQNNAASTPGSVQ